MGTPAAALPLYRRIVPPLYLLAALLAMIALHHCAPVVQFRTKLLMGIGTVLILGGVALSAWGAKAFRAAGTPVRPFEEATALVTTGPFRWTRNPMYAGMLLVLAGTWIALGSLTPVLILPIFFLVIRTWFIRHEEAAMAGRFKEAFSDYCRRVRRWI